MMPAMDTVCLNCGKTYGDHHGAKCPGAVTQFRRGGSVAPTEAEPKWLDAPTHDGIWVRGHEGEYKETARVIDGSFLGRIVGSWIGCKWWYVGPLPPDPPPPLPKAVKVMIRAYVCKTPGGMWRGSIGVPGWFDEPKAIIDESREKCVEWCRAFGVEPEVQHA